MELSDERIQSIYKYKYDCSEEEKTILKQIAIEQFAKDEKAQIEYAILFLLNEKIEKMTSQIKVLEKEIKENKHGSNNNNRDKNMDSACSKCTSIS